MKIAIIAALGAFALATPAWADAESASILLATVGYVAGHCPRMQPVPAEIRRIFKETGYEMEEFDHPGGSRNVTVPATHLLLKMERERESVICDRLWDQFGPTGVAFPGAFVWKAP